MNPATQPPARFLPAMAYDGQSDRMILFGGFGAGSEETWAYDFNTNTWTNMNPATAPSGRQTTALAYDSESDRIILFGGYTDISSNETWAYDYDSNRWTLRNPALRPSPRNGHGMAYDSQSDQVILFGGHDPDLGFNVDTWAYDFNSDSWTEMSPSPRPAAGFGHAMAYDADSDRVIIFAGRDEVGRRYETWAYCYDCNFWWNMNPDMRPPAGVVSGGMAYDAQSDLMILFGGIREGGSEAIDETWSYDYDTNTWTNMRPASKPTSRYGHAMAYDSQSKVTVLFGGETAPGAYSGETWAYPLGPSGAIPGDGIPLWALYAAGVGVVLAGATIAVLWRRRRSHAPPPSPPA